MAIAQVYTFHPHPGRTADFMAIAKKADKIFRGLGATTQTINSVSGGVAGTILYVVETADWKAFGDVAAKLQTDKAWLALAAEMSSTDKPTADLLSSSVYSEIPIG
jgi:hypothetical protein